MTMRALRALLLVACIGVAGCGVKGELSLPDAGTEAGAGADAGDPP